MAVISKTKFGTMHDQSQPSEIRCQSWSYS